MNEAASDGDKEDGGGAVSLDILLSLANSVSSQSERLAKGRRDAEEKTFCSRRRWDTERIDFTIPSPLNDVACFVKSSATDNVDKRIDVRLFDDMVEMKRSTVSSARRKMKCGLTIAYIPNTQDGI